MKKRHSFLLLFIAFALTGNVRTYAQGNPYENIPPADARVFDLFGKGDALGLWQYYQDSAQYISPYANLYGKLRMFNNFNRPDDALACLDSLFTHYPTQYSDGYYWLKAQLLFRSGKFKALSDYCRATDDFIFQNSNYKGQFYWFKELGNQLRETPDSQLEFPDGACTLPLHLSPSTQRIHLPASINGTELPNGLLMDTGAPTTLLSYQTAKRCNVRFLSQDTLSPTSVFGKVPSRSAIVDELRIKNMTFRNIYVLVALQDAPDFFKTNDIIGMRELSKCSSITFADHQITFRKNKEKAPLQPNMTLNNGQLFIHSSTGGQQEKFQLDTGSDMNYIVATQSESGKTVKLHSVLGDSLTFTVNNVDINSIVQTSKGLLGLYYLLSYDSSTLNFDQMRIINNGHNNRPYTYDHCINSADYANLERHKEWYLASTNKTGKWMIYAHLNFMKQRPQEAIPYIDSLFTSNSSIVTNSIPYLKNLRAAASAYIGDYPAAIRILKECVAIEPAFKGMINKCAALQKAGASSAQWERKKRVLTAQRDEKGMSLKAEINGTASEVYFSPDKTTSQISPEDAAKHHLRVIEYEEDSLHKRQIAVAESLTLGGMTLRNVVFSVDKQADCIRLGNDALRLIPQYTITRDKITLSSRGTLHPDSPDCHSLFLINYILYYYYPEGADVKRFAIGNPYPAAQTVALEQLLENKQGITVDMEHMLIRYGK